MRRKKLKLSVLLLFGLGLTGLQAQQAITTSGGDASGSGGSVSYSVGQVVYGTYTGANGSVAQGVQQTYKISVVSAIEDESISHISLIASPNPTTDYLNLLFEDFKNEKMNYQLFDQQGRLLESKPMRAIQTQIDMGNLPSALYLIHVTRENQVVKSFRIIKN